MFHTLCKKGRGNRGKMTSPPPQYLVSGSFKGRGRKRIQGNKRRLILYLGSPKFSSWKGNIGEVLVGSIFFYSLSPSPPLFLSIRLFCKKIKNVLLTDFKKASAEEKLNLFNSLLKGYQEEVDNLTKRAKFGENAFLNIYQKLYEAPDPYPLLASIAVSTRMFH